MVVTIGPAEDGPRSKVTVQDALRVLEAAQVANAGHFVVVSEPGAKNDGPLAGISAFFSSLFSGGSVAQDAYLIDSVVESDLTFTVIKTGSTEGVDDASQDTSNLVVSAEGASDTGGKVNVAPIENLLLNCLLLLPFPVSIQNQKPCRISCGGWVSILTELPQSTPFWQYSARRLSQAWV